MSQPTNPLDTGGSPAYGSELRLADLLPDYLNGHLSDSKRAEVETALEKSAGMREQLEFQSRLQIALRAKAETNDQLAVTVASSRGSGFAVVEDRITGSPLAQIGDYVRQTLGGAGMHAWMSASALLLVVGVVASSNIGDTQMPNNVFETHISVEQHDQATLRILPGLAVGSEEFAALLREYGLVLELEFTESNIAEVRPLLPDADIEAIAAALKEDKRVVFAKALSGREE